MTTRPSTETGSMDPSTETTQPGLPEQAGRFARSTATEATGRHVAVQDLNAYYGDQHAVKSFNIEYEPNKVTAMIGPSGSGKSTMVRCINRMHEEIPGARVTGKITIDGEDLYAPSVDVTAVRHAAGMVFQKPNPFPTMSIYDNVAAGPRLTGMRGGNLKERVEKSLRGAALWDEVKDRLAQPGIGLSGGQQQRLCIARTLAVEPEVILMDEPCSALDPIATLRIEELIDELKQRYTIVIVTHNMQQAARVADSTAFMLDGELIEVGPTERMFTKPNDERTEQYVSGKFG